MAVNDYALRTIEGMTKAPSWTSSLVPWSSTNAALLAIVTETFEEAMNVLSINMQRLIMEAETNLVNLNELEERLTTIHELVSREDSSLSSARSELLADLWTRAGGNRKTLRRYNRDLLMLKDLGEYRQQALVHVVTALQMLHSMSGEMEDLRERVAIPSLVGSRIPVEVHMRSIESGLERLKEGRIRAKTFREDMKQKLLTENM
jgi:hypothetical protein